MNYPIHHVFLDSVTTWGYIGGTWWSPSIYCGGYWWKLVFSAVFLWYFRFFLNRIPINQLNLSSLRQLYDDGCARWIPSKYWMWLLVIIGGFEVLVDLFHCFVSNKHQPCSPGDVFGAESFLGTATAKLPAFCARCTPTLIRHMVSRVFQKWHFVKEKNCNASTHPSGVYINHIQRLFYCRTSLEGQTT